MGFPTLAVSVWPRCFVVLATVMPYVNFF